MLRCCAARSGPEFAAHAVHCPQRATWHVPPEQADVAARGASAALSSGSLGPPSASGSKSSLSASSSTSTVDHKHGSRDSTPALTKEVALKVIPKKKVKGNEASVWGEMEVLKGLDHPNIVRLLYTVFDIALC